MKIEFIKLANSIKVGIKEDIIFRADRGFEISLSQAFIIKIVDIKTKSATYTTLMNTIFWVEEGESLEAVAAAKAPVPAKAVLRAKAVEVQQP